MKRNVSLIIASAGQGKRFLEGRKSRNGVGKVFQELGGKPLLAHAVDSFLGIPQIREIVIAVPRGTESWVRKNVLKVCEESGGPRRAAPRFQVVPGGATRAESVLNALRKTSPRNEWVAVHDGARPFPPKKMVFEMLEICRGGVSPPSPSGRGDRAPTLDAVILARPVVPTLKRVAPESGQVVETVDRSSLYEAETPQLVRRSLLLKAYENKSSLAATDESTLIESLGGRVKVLSHSGWNVKVTTPEDLKLAEAYYEGRGGVSPPGRGNLAPTTKIGFGKDTHRLVKGRKLFLGGVRIPYELGALGHSDGDALLHAVSDALLGAAAAGDIGDWFSDRNPGNKNIRSEKILKKVLELVRRMGWAPTQVDTVVLLEKPRLGPLKKTIQKNLARLLALGTDSVSIKAKTMEGLGPEGEGLAVTCEAVALLRKIS